MSSVFLDTAYAIAISIERDQYHDRAVDLSRRLEHEKRTAVTTEPVLVKIGNALAARRYRSAAIQLIGWMQEDPSIHIARFSEHLFQEGLVLYRDRPDKDWGLTDCMSFVVMRRRGITDALTADTHFQQAGFNALLSETAP